MPTPPDALAVFVKDAEKVRWFHVALDAAFQVGAETFCREDVARLRALLADREAQLSEAVRDKERAEHSAITERETCAEAVRDLEEADAKFEAAESQLQAVRELRDELQREIDTPNDNPMRLAISRPSEMLRYLHGKLTTILERKPTNG